VNLGVYLAIRKVQIFPVLVGGVKDPNRGWPSNRRGSGGRLAGTLRVMSRSQFVSCHIPCHRVTASIDSVSQHNACSCHDMARVVSLAL